MSDMFKKSCKVLLVGFPELRLVSDLFADEWTDPSWPRLDARVGARPLGCPVEEEGRSVRDGRLF